MQAPWRRAAPKAQVHAAMPQNLKSQLSNLNSAFGEKSFLRSGIQRKAAKVTEVTKGAEGKEAAHKLESAAF